MKALYKVNPQERIILDKAKDGDIDLFMDFYFRSPNSGTWWLPGAKTEHWSTGYDRLVKEWERLGKPDGKFSSWHNGVSYRVFMNHEMSKKFPDMPAFHHNHGILMLDWQKELHNDRHAFRTIVGGFGSGKTLAVVLSFLIYAATLPGYRGLALAPFSKQAKEVYVLAMSAIRNTKYEERFLRGSPSSPFPTLIVGNDYTNTENTIECYGIGDKDDADKLRTLTADNALIDQAEKIMDLQSVIRDVGTRFRGRELTSGRSRIGTMTFLANSGINDELWSLYDRAEVDPDKFYSLSPSTYDNIYLTDADIERYEVQVGDGDDNKRMYMYGGRPLGDGSEFSRVIMDRVRDPSLDELHEHLTRLGQKTTRFTTAGSGVTEWTLPYDPSRTYVVVSDPGTAAPPHRNSPVIMVWDVTDFDVNHPMTLSGFYWFNGRTDISVWAATYATVVDTYHAIGRNGFDATGYQKGYERWIQILHNLIAEKFELTATNKPMMLNDAKMLSSRGLIRMPVAVSSIYTQLAFYTFPEPEGLKQDLVVTYMMSAWYAKRLFYMSFKEEEKRKFDAWVMEDRNSRDMDFISERTGR
jgi:hypothetical protein